jgi:hypothetical protein
MPQELIFSYTLLQLLGISQSKTRKPAASDTQTVDLPLAGEQVFALQATFVALRNQLTDTFPRSSLVMGGIASDDQSKLLLDISFNPADVLGECEGKRALFWRNEPWIPLREQFESLPGCGHSVFKNRVVAMQSIGKRGGRWGEINNHVGSGNRSKTKIVVVNVT